MKCEYRKCEKEAPAGRRYCDRKCCQKECTQRAADVRRSGSERGENMRAKEAARDKLRYQERAAQTARKDLIEHQASRNTKSWDERKAEIRAKYGVKFPERATITRNNPSIMFVEVVG